MRASRAYPISGGTLLITRDGSTAVAADPDRAQVFLADLTTHAVRSIATGPDDEVGRGVEGEAGRVYVVARRGGAVLRIDVPSGTLLQRMPVCNAPRGIAYDATRGQLHVACASGALVTLDPTTGSVIRKLDLDDDLRDVVVADDHLFVTRFRNAELLVIDADGHLMLRDQPPQQGGVRQGPPTLAYRLAATNGIMVMVHQQSSSSPLGSGLGGYYGGNCGGSVTDTFISTVQAATVGTASLLPNVNIAPNPLGGATGPLDVAV